VRNRSSQDPLNYPIRLNNKLAALLGTVESVPGRPTQQTYQVFELLNGQLEAQVQAVEQILGPDLTAYNRLLQSKGLQPVAVERPARVTS
jgi:hypothetical protein